MKLVYLYQPVTNLPAAAEWYGDQLGFEEAWREGDTAISYWLPDRSAQVMVATDGLPPGPMYQVDDADAWVRRYPGIPIAVPRFDVPGGPVIGLQGPGGNVFYVFDQRDA